MFACLKYMKYLSNYWFCFLCNTCNWIMLRTAKYFWQSQNQKWKNPPTFWALYVHCNIQMCTANVRIFVGNEFLWSNCLNFLNDCTRLFTCKASTFFNRFSDFRLFSSVIPLFSMMTIYLSLLNNLITISFGHLNKHLSRKCHFL